MTILNRMQIDTNRKSHSDLNIFHGFFNITVWVKVMKLFSVQIQGEGTVLDKSERGDGDYIAI